MPFILHRRELGVHIPQRRQGTRPPGTMDEGFKEEHHNASKAPSSCMHSTDPTEAEQLKQGTGDSGIPEIEDREQPQQHTTDTEDSRDSTVESSQRPVKKNSQHKKGSGRKSSKPEGKSSDKIRPLKQFIEKIAELERNLTRHRSNYDIEKERLLKEHERELSDVEHFWKKEQRRWDREKETLRHEHQAQIARAKSEYEKELSHLKEDHIEEIERLKSKFDKHWAQWKQEGHQLSTERNNLEKERNEYSAQLLVRDNFKGMEISEIKSKFQSLVAEVEDMAHLEWRQESAEKIQHLSPKPKMLMRHIVQDYVWAVLQSCVFCSPFRIFGDEGMKLEKQWCREFQTDGDSTSDSTLIWPDPSMKAERWRYINVQECRAALRPPIPSELDPRYKFKMSFITAREELNAKLVSDLQVVTDVDPSNIDKITKKAINLWLEMGMQRFRLCINISVHQYTSIKDRLQDVSRSGADRNMKLVLVPEVVSYGTSTGVDLHIKKVIRKESTTII